MKRGAVGASGATGAAGAGCTRCHRCWVPRVLGAPQVHESSEDLGVISCSVSGSSCQPATGSLRRISGHAHLTFRSRHRCTLDPAPAAPYSLYRLGPTPGERRAGSAENGARGRRDRASANAARTPGAGGRRRGRWSRWPSRECVARTHRRAGAGDWARARCGRRGRRSGTGSGAGESRARTGATPRLAARLPAKQPPGCGQSPPPTPRAERPALSPIHAMHACATTIESNIDERGIPPRRAPRDRRGFGES